MPHGDDEAPPLIEALAARGVEAVPAIWDEPGLDWLAFDLVVIRSTWDYTERREAFLAWAESLPRVLNTPDVLRWNTDKRYLETLSAPTTSARFVEPGARFDIPDEPFVVKPAVGAGSIGAARYAAGDQRARRHVEELHAAGRTVMVQPCVEAVDSEGEVALIYLHGSFSHAVHKESMLAAGAQPGSGLYLEETIAGTEPSPAELDVGEQALAGLPFEKEDLLYARIDLLPGPLVLEVELTEPSLFIGYAEGAAERFAEAIVAAGKR